MVTKGRMMLRSAMFEDVAVVHVAAAAGGEHKGERTRRLLIAPFLPPQGARIRVLRLDRDRTSPVTPTRTCTCRWLPGSSSFRSASPAR